MFLLYGTTCLGDPTWLLPKKSKDCKKVVVLSYANEGIKRKVKVVFKEKTQ